MKSFQFTVAKKENEQWVEINGLLTPTVTAETMAEAYQHPDIVKFFEQYPEHRIYRRV